MFNQRFNQSIKQDFIFFVHYTADIYIKTRAANSKHFNRVRVRVRVHKKFSSPSSSSSSLNFNFSSSSSSSQNRVEKIQSE